MAGKSLTSQPIKLNEIRNAEDFEHAVQIMRWLLKPMGLWPVKCSETLSILRVASIVTCSLLLAFLLIPNCLYIFLVEKDFKVRLKLVGPLSFTIMSICKYSGFLLKGREIGGCVKEIAKDWHEIESTVERKIMLESVKDIRFFTTICAAFMYTGGLPFTMVVPLVRGSMLVDNITLRFHAYPGYFIYFNPQIRPMYEIIFFIHCLCGLVTYTVNIGLCSLAILCILHICGQISITSSMLQDLTSNFDRKYLGKIVKKHIHSITYYFATKIDRNRRFAMRLESILTEMCMVEIIGCTFNICMLGYYFMMEYEESDNLSASVYICLLISFTFNIFIFCYIGDLLTHKCNCFGDVAYMINWHQLSGKEAQNLVLVVLSTYHPVVLTAGKLVTLSLRTFANVLKVSLTYLNMLRTLTM